MVAGFRSSETENIDMDIERLRQIKHLAIIALFSDNDFLDILVLKGGTALEFYDIDYRLSIDLDFSIGDEFKQDLSTIKEKIEVALQDSFREDGYIVFDVKLRERPNRLSPDLADFWGGYIIEFKVIEIEKHEKLSTKIDSLRKNATVVGQLNKRTFSIEISKHEYCEPKQESELNGYTIYIYPPSMLVCEKIRAICQQMPEYGEIGRSSSQTARARDFYDIYLLIERYRIELTSEENIHLLKNVFAAKRVPLTLIAKVYETKEFHRDNFTAVKATVGENAGLKDFDFYFNYVVAYCQRFLETLGIK
jgi:predicted nucleotidyltransferase component of viral defense system